MGKGALNYAPSALWRKKLYYISCGHVLTQRTNCPPSKTTVKTMICTSFNLGYMLQYPNEHNFIFMCTVYINRKRCIKSDTTITMTRKLSFKIYRYQE